MNGIKLGMTVGIMISPNSVAFMMALHEWNARWRWFQECQFNLIFRLSNDDDDDATMLASRLNNTAT